MKTEDIEKLSLKDLRDMANDADVIVPETLSEGIRNLACAVSLAANGKEARVSPWLWGLIPAAAAAAIACVLLFRPPQRVKDTFSDPTLAYIETMRAFSLFNDAFQDIK